MSNELYTLRAPSQGAFAHDMYLLGGVDLDLHLEGRVEQVTTG
jgi:hypothetical protein